MAIKYTKIIHSKALQNIPKFGIFVMKIFYHLAARHDLTLMTAAADSPLLTA
jgi:hypothetical protein